MTPRELDRFAQDIVVGAIIKHHMRQHSDCWERMLMGVPQPLTAEDEIERLRVVMREESAR